MSEKLFSRLYWRPYLLIGICMLLVLVSSLIPYLLPHEWLAKHYPGYDLYMFKSMVWLIKLAMLLCASDGQGNLALVDPQNLVSGSRVK